MSIKTWNNLTNHLQAIISNVGDGDDIMTIWKEQKSTVMKILSSTTTKDKLSGIISVSNGVILVSRRPFL